jgi:glucokinase
MRGCLETCVNAAAMIRYAGGSFRSAAQVIAAANAGEKQAVEAIRILGRHLARGSATLIALLDPQALILGGGLTESNTLLFSVLREELPQFLRSWETRRLQILPSELGYYGGVVGAAALAFENTFESTRSSQHYDESVVQVP